MSPKIGNLVLVFVSVFDRTPESIRVCPSLTLTPPVSNLLTLKIFIGPQFGIKSVSVTEANSGLKLKVLAGPSTHPVYTDERKCHNFVWTWIKRF